MSEDKRWQIGTETEADETQVENRGLVAGRYAEEPEDPRTLISSTMWNTLQVQDMLHHMQWKSKSMKSIIQT